MAKAEVLPLTEADIPGILPIIRQADRDEIEGALQIDLSTAIADGLSDCCKASKIVVDGLVVAIFGDVRNTVAIRWLEWLGFTFGEPVGYGPLGMPFKPFCMTRST